MIHREVAPTVLDVPTPVRSGEYAPTRKLLISTGPHARTALKRWSFLLVLVLLGGCDKTTPGLLLGAISMDVPAIYLPAGFTLGAEFRGERLGSGTGAFRWSKELMAGRIDYKDWKVVEDRLWSSPGTCNTMGTASTMTALSEAMGLS